MAVAIVPNEHGFAKQKKGKISLVSLEKGLFMARSQLLDVITPKQRKSVPFRFYWLKFKTGFFGLTLKRGLVS